jgi:hypothetical protein
VPQEAKSNGVGSGAAELSGEKTSLAGFAADLNDDTARFDVLEKAFDYRGDVKLVLADGRSVEGYLFDRRRGTSAADSFVRLMPSTGEGNVTVKYADVRRAEFNPRDPAAGKSFETWLKKYVEKKLAGQKASIESEPLE